ncbi:MAG: isocitrate lyase/phosphoenolpyruvate mutase family protein, partial [Parvularculaceae bacterium]
MLFTKKSAAEKRTEFRKGLASGKLLQFPGAFNPLCAQLIERKGFDGVYISGAVMSADLCLPDIGLATLTEFAERGCQIARVTDLPAIIDIDTGFGEPMAAARTIRTMEELGLAGCHIEDQVSPKRCGHLDGKEIVPTEIMIQRVKAAADAKRDPNFLLIARSDARAVEGL